MRRIPTCQTCRHPDRQAIEAAILDGEPREAVARLYGLPSWTVRWHVERHMVLPFEGEELERQAIAFRNTLGQMIRERERGLARATLMGRRGAHERFRRQLVLLGRWAWACGLRVPRPPRHEMPPGAVRGGRLVNQSARQVPPMVRRSATPADPWAEFRRQRLEQYRRLGLIDR